MIARRPHVPRRAQLRRARSATSRSTRDGPLCACGERGHWEAIASGTALGRMARGVDRGRAGRGDRRGGRRRRRHGRRGVTSRRRRRGGDAEATALLHVRRQRCARPRRASRTSSIPQCIVIAGGLVVIGRAAVRSARRCVPRPARRDRVPSGRSPIVPAVLGERAGAVGAAVLARDLLVKLGLDAAVVRRRSRDPDRRRARRRRRRYSTPSSCTTTCGATTRRRAAPRSSASRCWARSPPRRRRSMSARSLRARHCGRAATLATAFETVHRVSGGRLIAGIGAGDSQSRAENEAFGLDIRHDRRSCEALAHAARAASGRGFPVWIGGHARHVLDDRRDRRRVERLGWHAGGVRARWPPRARRRARRDADVGRTDRPRRRRRSRARQGRGARCRPQCARRRSGDTRPATRRLRPRGCAVGRRRSARRVEHRKRPPLSEVVGRL